MIFAAGFFLMVGLIGMHIGIPRTGKAFCLVLFAVGLVLVGVLVATHSMPEYGDPTLQ